MNNHHIFLRGEDLLTNKYCFHQVVERRGTGSMKWDFCKDVFGREDVLPMWVADADWPAPPEIQKALHALTDHGIFGYTRPTRELNEVVVDWVHRHYQWSIDPEWILYTSGVVPSLHLAVKAFTNPGDEVIIQSPVYYPFYSSIRNNGARVANNPLLYCNDYYQMDLDHLKEILTGSRGPVSSPPRVRMLILCSPHNPVGRVWKEEELLHLGEICQQHNILVVSDEIHADLILKERQHYPFSKFFPQNSITMLAPSKTFNIPGIKIAVMIIPDQKVRSIFYNCCNGVISSGNLFALEALKVAYSECDDWLREQILYLKENLYMAMDFLQFLPRIKVIEPEGTYLLWLDCREFISQPEKLNAFMLDKARVAMDDGQWFGAGGEGFMRLNFACPRSILREGLQRIQKAVKDSCSHG